MPAINPYYDSVASRYRAAKYISVVLLIIFLLFSFIFKRDEITVENLQYLMKFVSFANAETSITAPRINYSASDKMKLQLFIGDLCYLSTDSYTLYDSRGNTIMSEQLKYLSPILKTSQKYVLCYDLGSNNFSVFNTFSKLYSGTSDYAINDADIADDGSFVIATSSREYQTAVITYNSDFKATSRILRDSYLMDLKIKSDGSELAMITVSSVDGSFKTRIELVNPGSSSINRSATIDGMGWWISYAKDRIFVVTDEEILIYDNELSLVKSVKHPQSPALIDASDSHIAVSYSTGHMGNAYLINIYDLSGRLVYSGDADGKLSDISHDDSGNYVFVLTGDTLTRINLLNRKIGSIEVASGAFQVIPQSEDSFLLAYGNHAETHSSIDFNEHYFDRSEETENKNN